MSKKERRRREARIRAACCPEHGFGRNAFGRQQYEDHIRHITRTVEEAVSKSHAGLLAGSGVAQGGEL